MIVYLDSSFLVRAYLADEDGHDDVEALLADPEVAATTGTWTRLEVSGALVRAARSGRIAAGEGELLALLDSDLDEGRVTLLSVPQAQVELQALNLVRTHGIRAMDAWHLAVANLALPALAEVGEPMGFATRDRAQSEVARELGLALV